MKVKMVINNNIELNLSELDYDLYQLIKQDLTFDNPAYSNALKNNYPIFNIKKQFYLYRTLGSTLILPRGYGKKLLQRLNETGTGYTVQDDRLLLPRVEFNSKIKLRDYQSKAVDKLVRERQGGVSAPCGSGKTVVLLEAMARIGQPSLWITHTRELLYQTIERACQFFDITEQEVGVLGDGEFSLGQRLTVALVQTLSRVELDQIKNEFGAIFIDEAHHLPAASFRYPVSVFPAHFRLWASATPNRSDGLEEMIFVYGGPVLHEINQFEVPTMIPNLEVIKTSFKTPADHYTKMITNLINNSKRNELIVNTIKAETAGNYCLVLSDRKEHLKILEGMLNKALPNKSVEIITGDMSKKVRTEIMDRVQNRQVDILLATQLAREGLDIKHLNRLFLTTPKKANGAIQQEVGRIARPVEGKYDAVVFDFWDVDCPIINTQFWERRKVYNKLGIKWQSKKARIS